MTETKHIYFKTRAVWRQWLAANHASHPAIWLIYDKGPERQLSWQDIVQEALCFGWIDSRLAKHSETQSRLYLGPLKPSSGWSKINKQSVETLIANGQMMSAGLAAIKFAKANGTWDKLKLSDELLPPELQEQFEQWPEAGAHFEAFSDSAKRLILEWIYAAKRDETRKKRIAETVAAAKLNQKSHQYLHKPTV